MKHANLREKILKTAIKNVYVGRFFSGLKQPMKYQENILSKILRANKYTEFGRMHGFSRISNISDYQRKIPVRSYDEFTTFIHKVKQGESNVLTKEDPIFFATTSGTTSAMKWIPITYTQKRAMTMGNLIFGYFLLENHPGCLRRRWLSLVARAYDGLTDSGIPWGSLTGYSLETTPRLMKQAYPPRLSRDRDFERKYYLISRYALGHSIGSVLCADITTIKCLCDFINNHKESLIRDIYDGTASYSSPELRGMKFRPDRERARELNRICESGENQFIPKNYWPHVDFVLTITGGFAKHYHNEIRYLFGEHVSLEEPGILGSEGRYSISTDPTITTRGIVAYSVQFLEFMDVETRAVVTLDKVTQGREYEIILTNWSGLYRYRVGDVVRVVDFAHRTPVIEFVRRAGEWMNIGGENFTAHQVMNALKYACHKAKVDLEYFVFIPKVGKYPYYSICVEQTKNGRDPLSKEEFSKLLRLIENGLCDENHSYYRRRYEYGNIGEPSLTILRSGARKHIYHQVCAGNGKDSQAKLPHLTQDPHFNETLLADFQAGTISLS